MSDAEANRAHRRGLIAALLPLVAIGAREAPAQPVSPRAWAAETLARTNRPRSAQFEQALTMVTSGNRAQVEEAARILADPASDPELVGLLLRAGGAAHWLPPELAPAIIGRARSGPDAERLLAIAALGSCRTRDAAAALVALAGEEGSPPIRSGALAALVRLSGRDDIEPTTGAWQEWLAGALNLTDRQWERELLDRHLAREARLEDRLGRERVLAVEAYRRLHLLTPVEERSGLLAELLRSEISSLRVLGLELATRELSESRSLSGDVGGAVLELLTHADPAVRRGAASLVASLAPAGAEHAVAVALQGENDPGAADALLAAATRWPTPALRGPVLRWLAAPATRVRALDAAWALRRSGHLGEEDDAATVLDAARAIAPEERTGAICRLLATLGDESDIATLRDMLATAEESTRAMAADALALRSDQVEALLAAAATDPALFGAASRAAQAHLRDARGFAAVASLPAPSTLDRTRALREYAADLPTPELVRLAELAGGPSDAIELLTTLTAPERASAESRETQWIRGIGLLARSLLDLARPGEALAALDLAKPLEGRTWPAELTPLRVAALVWLNRPEQATEECDDPDAWLDALERTLAEPHAADIAERIALRFDGLLDAEQLSRLSSLAERAGRRGASQPVSDGQDGG